MKINQSIGNIRCLEDMEVGSDELAYRLSQEIGPRLLTHVMKGEDEVKTYKYIHLRFHKTQHWHVLPLSCTEPVLDWLDGLSYEPSFEELVGFMVIRLPDDPIKGLLIAKALDGAKHSEKSEDEVQI